MVAWLLAVTTDHSTEQSGGLQNGSAPHSHAAVLQHFVMQWGTMHCK
jgi:hypothetical protein